MVLEITGAWVVLTDHMAEVPAVMSASQKEGQHEGKALSTLFSQQNRPVFMKPVLLLPTLSEGGSV